MGDKFTVFENWLLDNGAKFPKLELKVCRNCNILVFVVVIENVCMDAGLWQ